VKRLLPLTPEQLAVAEKRLLNPAPGSKIAAARDAGIDLNLMLRLLRLTPEERITAAQNLINALSRIQIGADDPRRHLVNLPELPIRRLRFPWMCSSYPERVTPVEPGSTPPHTARS
jgi:hypothetical protein